MHTLWCWLAVFLMGCTATGSGSEVAAEASAESGGYYDDGSDGDAETRSQSLGYSKQLQPADGAVQGMVDRAFGMAQAPESEDPAPKQPGVKRQVIYSAQMRLVVVSTSSAMLSIQAFAEQAGGYLQESDANSITVRVPAAAFDATLGRIAGLGELVDRAIQASDVTEELLDLDIRLDNARRTRDRLLEHLSKSTKIEDTLKIEAELARVSVEIERMEGKQRFLQSQVAMSRIRVQLNMRAPRDPSAPDALGLPFDWVERLGDGLVAGNVESLPRKPRFLANGPKFDPPAEFIRYFSSKELVEAMNADGLRIKVQRHENYDKGVLSFWSKLARSSLVASRSVLLSAEQDLGDDRALLAGSREVAGEPHGYLLMIARTRERVFTFEAWGPKDLFDAQYEALVKSARSLQN